MFFFKPSFSLKKTLLPLNSNVVRMSITGTYSPLLLNRPECFLAFSFYRFALHSYFLPEATLALFPFPSQPTLEFSTPPSLATSHTVAFCNTAALTYFSSLAKETLELSGVH